MAKVGIIMGSDSDLEVMKGAAEILEGFGIDISPKSSDQFSELKNLRIFFQ